MEKTQNSYSENLIIIEKFEAFMNYMNVLADFLERVDYQYPTNIENEELNELLKTIHNQDNEIEELQAEVKKLRARKVKSSEA